LHHAIRNFGLVNDDPPIARNMRRTTRSRCQLEPRAVQRTGHHAVGHFAIVNPSPGVRAHVVQREHPLGAPEQSDRAPLNFDRDALALGQAA
jgi:hypothetical protein